MALKCKICKKVLNNSTEDVKTAPCSHAFHLSCLQHHLDSQTPDGNSCPECLEELTMEQCSTMYRINRDEIDDGETATTSSEVVWIRDPPGVNSRVNQSSDTAPKKSEKPTQSGDDFSTVLDNFIKEGRKTEGAGDVTSVESDAGVKEKNKRSAESSDQEHTEHDVKKAKISEKAASPTETEVTVEAGTQAPEPQEPPQASVLPPEGLLNALQNLFEGIEDEDHLNDEDDDDEDEDIPQDVIDALGVYRNHFIEAAAAGNLPLELPPDVQAAMEVVFNFWVAQTQEMLGLMAENPGNNNRCTIA